MRFDRGGFAALAVSVAVFALGCATARDVARGNWYELATPRFVLWTNGSPERGRALLEDLERFRQVLQLHTTAEEREASPPVRIFLTDGGAAFGALTDKNFPVVGYARGTPRGVFAIARSGTVRAQEREARELLKYVSAGAAITAQGMRLPTWYRNGFATYLAATQFREDGAYTVGCRPQYLNERDPLAPWLKVAELFEFDRRYAETDDPAGGRRVSLWAQSWYAFHYFAIDPERTRRLQQYLGLWVAAVPAETAIERAFGISAEQLDSAIRSHASAGDYACSLAQPKGGALPVPAIVARPISEAEAQHRIGDLLLAVVGPTDEALDLLQSAAAGQQSAATLRSLARLYWTRAERKEGDRKTELQQAQQLLREAQAMEPAALEALVLEGHLLRMQVELTRESDRAAGKAEVAAARRAYRKALRADETLAEAYYGLGLTYLLDDNGSEEPIAALEAAAFLVPSGSDIALALGTIQLRRGQGQQARAALEYALQRSSDKVQREEVRAALVRARALPAVAP